jgi:hypothetical protein
LKFSQEKIKQNNIRSVICWEYSDEYGKPSTNRRELYTDKYDKEGMIIEKIFFTTDSSKLITRCLYEYLSSGKLVKVSWFDWRTDNELDFYIESNYSEEGVLIEEVKYDGSGEVLCKWKYKYDSKGNPLQIAIINSFPANLCNLEEYKYDKFGTKTEATYSFPNGSISKWSYSNIYDKNGNLIEKIKINSDGTLDIRKKYLYDDRELIIEKLSYPDYLKGEFVRKTYEYKS